MERRLYYGIAWPGLCISVVFGIALIIASGFPGWLHAKLAFAAVLVVYHLWCGQLRKKLLNEQCSWSGKQFRLFNEIPSVLLVIIVFVAVFKNALSWSVFSLISGGLILVIGGTVHWLSKLSQNKAGGKNLS